MSFLVQLLFQIVLPAVLLFNLFKKDYRQRRDWIIDVTLVAVILLFVFLVARWDWFSYYLRILLFPAFGLVVYVAYRCIDKKKFEPAEQNPRVYAIHGAKGLVILVFLALIVSILRSSFAPAEAMFFSYPLRGGVYYVEGGGDHRWINSHQAFPSQDFSLDISRLNVFGNRANGIDPEALEAYPIFGDKVYSPCRGSIAAVEDGHPDNVPPAIDTTFYAGNHVVVACQGVKVMMAHLKQGSITVVDGQEVTTGLILGQVGNSGNSSRPHLHIHAERGGHEGEFSGGDAVPMVFNDRFLVRNSLFSGRTRLNY